MHGTHLSSTSRCWALWLKLKPKYIILHSYPSFIIMTLFAVDYSDISITLIRNPPTMQFFFFLLLFESVCVCGNMWLWLSAARWVAAVGIGPETAGVMTFSQRATEQRVIPLHERWSHRFREAQIGSPRSNQYSQQQPFNWCTSNDRKQELVRGKNAAVDFFKSYNLTIN